MKKITTILLLAVILTSCSSDISFSELVKRDDIYYKVNSDIPYSGNVVDFHNRENKIKSVEGKLKNGKFDGKWVAYYSNGQIKEVWNYIKGIKNDKYIKYRDNGQIIKEEEYLNGEKNGVWTTYFNSGTKDKVIEYKNGHMDGVYIEYFSNGYLGMSEQEGFKEKGYYSMSSKDGEWRKRNKYGTEVLTQNYKNGILNGFSRQLLKFGNWVGYTWKGNYSNNSKNGEWTLLDNNKNIVQTHLYKNDEDVTLIGIWKATNLSTKKSYYVKFDKTNFYYSANKPYKWINEDLHYRDSYKYYKYRAWYPYERLSKTQIRKYEIKGFHRISIHGHLHDIIKFSLNSFTIEGGYGNMKYKYDRVGKISSTSNKIVETKENKNNSKQGNITTYAVINDPDGYTNLREGKSSSSKIVQKVYENEEFVVFETNDKWWKVHLNNGKSGFMHKSRIKITREE